MLLYCSQRNENKSQIFEFEEEEEMNKQQQKQQQKVNEIIKEKIGFDLYNDFLLQYKYKSNEVSIVL